MMDTTPLPGEAHAKSNGSTSCKLDAPLTPADFILLTKSLDARGRFKCAACGKLFRQDQVAVFLRHTRSFHCRTCKKESRCFTRMVLHRRSSDCQYLKECKSQLSELKTEESEWESVCNMFQCDHCGKLAKTERGLKSHIAFRHQDKGANSKTAPEKSHKIAVKRKKGRVVQWQQCKLCSQPYYSKECHFNSIRYLKCSACGLLFECRGLTVAHKKTCRKNHDAQPAATEINEEVTDEPPQPDHGKTPPTQFMCVHCDDPCPSEEVLRNHSRPTNCLRCGFLQACSKMLANHLDCCRFEAAPQPVVPRYKCPLCGKSCEDAAQLGSHVLCCRAPGSPKEQFDCKLCGKIFYEASKLESHEQRYHPDHMAQAELIRVLSMENQKMKQVLTTSIVQNKFVKKEPVELITLDESDDESLAVKVEKELEQI